MEVFLGYPPDLSLHTCGSHVGRELVPAQCRTPPGLGWGCVAPHVETGSCPTTLPSPVLPRVRTYLAGSRARRGHRSAAAFPALAAAPQPQDSGPAPAPGSTNRAVPITVTPNPRRSGGDRLLIPPPRLQHLSDSGTGRGRAATRRLGSPGGKTLPHSSPEV